MERAILHFWQAEYWRCAFGELKKLRILCLAAVMAGLIVAVELIYIPVGENLRIMFSFLLLALCGAISGPVVTAMVGVVSDILGAVIFPSGAFFPGYTLTAVVTSLLFALFLYRQRITVLRLACCKLSVNLFANVLLNSVWSSILMGKGYVYYLSKSIVKNALLLPIEILMLAFMFGALYPLLRRYDVAVKQRHRLIDLW